MPISREILDKIEALTALQEKKRAALAEGRFDGLAHIDAEAAALLTQLEAVEPQADVDEAARKDLEDRLERLREIASTNGKLTEAAQKGVRSAIDRLSAMAAAETEMGAYNKAGQMITQSGDRSNLTKKF